MDTATLLVFTLVALVAIATPGPTVLLALANGSRYGLRRSVPGMFGAVASDIVLVVAVALGLGALLAASEFWFSVLKYVGAAYLAWLGWRLLRSQGGFDLPANGEAGSAGPERALGLPQVLPGGGDQPQGLPVLLGPAAAVHRPGRAQAPQYLAIGVVFCVTDFS